MPVTPRTDPKSRQVVTPRSSRRVSARPRKASGGIKLGKVVNRIGSFSRPIIFIVALVLVMIGYNALGTSRVFRLRAVTVAGCGDPVKSEIERSVRKTVGQSTLLETDLSEIRQKIETMPRVRSASVARVLPDGVFVSVVERKPAVLVRRDTEALVWLDEDAVEMGEFSELRPEGADQKPQEVPPVAKGFVEGVRSQAAIAEDRERIAIYKQLESDFSSGPNAIWNIIDQIDLTFTKDVYLRLAHPPVVVHVGSTDFRKRFEKALQVLHASIQGDADLLSRYRVQDITRLMQNAGNISFIDAAKPERSIVVNFATPGAQKKAGTQDKK